MAYQLTPDLMTGNSLIDQEHKQLIDAINSLLEACGQGQGRSKVVETGKFLNDYTAKHFADEEKLQLGVKYPDYTKHKQYHEAFKKTTAGILQGLEKEGPTLRMVGEINKALAGWLINHIKQEDKKLAEYIRSH